MTMPTKKPSSIPDRLSKLATRGNRSVEAAMEMVEELTALREHLDAIIEATDLLEAATETYETNDPADCSGTDAREQAADARNDAWYDIQAVSEEAAQAIDSLIEALGMEPMK